MSYTFTNRPFEWSKAGADPTTYEIALGLQGGMALPAAFVNQQWTKTYLAVDEIQTAIENGLLGDNANEVISNSINVGSGHTVNSNNSCYAVFGDSNSANSYNFVIGKRSKTPTAANPATTVGDLFVVGSGLSGGARSNAMRITAGGAVMGTQAYTASGADFAEMFEWEDGNKSKEDRRGLFVTLNGDKIRLATSNDKYIAGVVSATPTVIGDAHTDDWVGKYVTDIFGAKLLKDDAWILTDKFDESADEDYTSRTDRCEWSAIGLVGKLVVVDDGTCQVNGYCYPSKNGIATDAPNGYRVLSRLDESHVKILLK